jgi:hypothetical protein
MALRIPDVKFELNAVYKTYADQLLLAGNISDFLLDNANIDAAGGQVEGSLRVLLKSLLPERVSVSHGHIVDKKAQVSYQQDVLIAESFYTKSLIKSLDGTEFYPIESIFATGEVKKKWSQKYLLSTIKSIERTKNELSRNSIKADQLASGSEFITLPGPVTQNPIRNPFFCFTFSLDFSKDYNEKKIAAIYHNPENGPKLPNITVILNRGIFVLVDDNKLNMGQLVIKLYPEFAESGTNRWIMLKLSPEESFAYLIFMLTQHINDTILEKVSAMEYAQSMITISPTQISPLILL